jgi:hypothetical protein
MIIFCPWKEKIKFANLYSLWRPEVHKEKVKTRYVSQVLYLIPLILGGGLKGQSLTKLVASSRTAGTFFPLAHSQIGRLVGWLVIQQPVGICPLAQCHMVIYASVCEFL